MSARESSRTRLGAVALWAVWAVLLAGALALSAAAREHVGLLVLISAGAAMLGAVVAWLLQSRQVTHPTTTAPVAAPAPRGTALSGGAPVATTVQLTSVGVSLPKAGAGDGENEDAWAATGNAVAVSDGASSSYRSGVWARTLCDRYVGEQPAGSQAATWALNAARAFRDTPDQPADQPTDQPAGESDWISAGLEGRPSYATFTGLHVTSAPEGLRWSALAVGDSVVLHLRKGEDAGWRLVTGFPLESSAAFAGAPELLDSHASSASDLPALRTVEGLARPDDAWVLATDEAARWALARHEQDRPVWDSLATATADTLTHLLGEARATDEVINDDLTLVRVGIA